jgi:peptidyl-prolyl cis-trans isomerase C
MRVLPALLFICSGALWAQTAPPAPTLPDLPGNTVVAVFDDGVKLTMDGFQNLVAALPQDQQQMALTNRQVFLHNYAVIRKLAHMAEEEGLDKASPAKERLEFQRMSILMNEKLMRTFSLAEVTPEEISGYYETNRERFKQVKVKALYVSFSPDDTAATDGKKPLNEKQALAKVDKLLAEIRGGADFVKLVKANSDDETSRDKDGDFLTVRVNDNLPDAMRAAVFQLKEGQVSDPVRQPNGFYLFRAEQVAYRPLAEVRDEIFMLLQKQRGASALRQIDNDTKVEFPNAAFAGSPGAAPEPPSPAPTAQK